MAEAAGGCPGLSSTQSEYPAKELRALQGVAAGGQAPCVPFTVQGLISHLLHPVVVTGGEVPWGPLMAWPTTATGHITEVTVTL